MAIAKENILIMDPSKIEHHKIASLHREMSDAEFKALILSIEEIGQIEPVKVYRGKLIDGRHRQRALIELGIHDIKVIELPNNTSLSDVKEIAMGTEIRRADNVAQKAIRGYKWYMDNADNATQAAAATKFSVSRPDISNAKKLYDKVGSETIDKLYRQGYLIYASKRYTTLQSILKLLNTEEEEQKDREPLSAEVEAINDILNQLLIKGDIAGIAQAESIAKKLRMKDV